MDVTERLQRGGLLPFVVLLVAVAAFGLATVAALRGAAGDGELELGVGAKKVGLVELTGPIVSGRLIVEALGKLAEDKRVAAILLRVDSPGGAVGPSQEIYEAVLRARAKKPVVVSMGAVAASGGFYVASAGTQVIANAGTLTGSIGVIMAFLDASQLFDWAKVRMEVVKTGRFKDTGAAYRPITDAERDYLQGVADQVLDQFVADVVAGRAAAGVSEPTVRAVADGRILTGAEAQRLKLVDRLGGYASAVSLAGELGGIAGTPDIYTPRLGPSWIERVLDEGVASQLQNALPPMVPLWAIWLP